MLLDKLKSEKKEMDTISSILKGVMCESERDKLGDSQEKSIEKLDDDIENYLERYDKILDDNDDTLTTATERSIQAITSTVPITVEQPTQSYDKFTCYTDLKPKYLEKESNLLEVKTWTRQAGQYITADYKSSPPKKGIFRYMSPLLHQTWISALECKDPDNRNLEELLKAIEEEAKL